MKRILHVVSCLELGGTEAFIMNMYRQIDRSEYQFDFVVFVEKDYPYCDEIEKMGGKIFFSGLPSIKNLIPFIKRFTSIVRSNGPYTAVHSHVNIQNAPVMLAAYLAGIKKRVSHSHSSYIDTGSFPKSFKYFIERVAIDVIATDYLACSNDAGYALYGRRYFAEHGKTILNGINVDGFTSHTRQCVEQLDLLNISQDHGIILGNISRFDSNKNPLFTIRVFSEFLKLSPNSVLIMGGVDGGLLTEAKKLAETLNLSKNVRFIGQRRDVSQCLSVIDIFLLPSYYEGFPIVFIEAQASGCFCVASTKVSKQTCIVDDSAMYLSLETNAKEWADEVFRAYAGWIRPTIQTIRSDFLKHKLDIESSCRSLCEVYNGES